MPIWITPKGESSITLEGVTFRIRHLTAREKARVTDLIIGLNAERILEIIRIGVSGWSGNGAPECFITNDGYLADPEGYLAAHPLEARDELLKEHRPRTEWKSL